MKDKIILLAEKLYIKHGVKQVTMDDIAQEMTMSKKTIYTYFPRKENLVEVVVFSVFKRVKARIEALIAENNNPILEIIKIETLLAEHIDTQTSAMMHQLQKYYPNLYLQLTTMQSQAIETTFSKNLERGLKLGLYREDINVDVITKIYYTTLINLQNQAVFPEEDYTCCNLKREYMIYHLHGIAAAKGQKLITKYITEHKI